MKNILLSQLKLMYPGLKVKRWLLLVLLGIILATAGLIVLLGNNILMLEHQVDVHIFKLSGFTTTETATRAIISCILILAGLLFIALAIKLIISNVVRNIDPKSKTGLADIMFENQILREGLKMAVIGGGTGLSTILRGLKEYSENITAIVSVTDNGGSTGRLRQEQDIPAPGDIRNCIVALADKGSDMEKLFQYRFNTLVPELEKHSFGNLFIATLTQITGSFETAVERFADILAIRGQVVPCSSESIDLIATFEDGTEVRGETDIVDYNKPIKSIRLSDRNAKAPKRAVDAIMEADIVILGPGSLYTSIVPNLLVKDIRAALIKTRAPKILICNIMTQPGESDGLTASGHCRVIQDIIGRKKILDYALVNTDQPVNSQSEKYMAAGQYYVKADINEIAKMGIKPVYGSYVNPDCTVKHDPNKLAEAIMKAF